MFIHVLAFSVFALALPTVANSQSWTSPDGFLSITPPDVNEFKPMPAPPPPFVGLWVSNDESMKFGVTKMQILTDVKLIQSSAEEGLAKEINGEVIRLPTRQVAGHEVWNMTAKGASVELTQAMIRHDGAIYKLMAVTIGRTPDPVAVNRFIDSFTIVHPAATTAGLSTQSDAQPIQDLGGGVDFHDLSKSIGGAGALIGIGLLVYFMTRGKKNR